MHGTPGTALSLILHFQTWLGALLEPPLHACQSHSLAFVRPNASTQACLCCSRFKPAAENDWLAWGEMGSHSHLNIFCISEQICPVTQWKGGNFWGQKGRGGKETVESSLLPPWYWPATYIILGPQVTAWWHQSVKSPHYHQSPRTFKKSAYGEGCMGTWVDMI